MNGETKMSELYKNVVKSLLSMECIKSELHKYDMELLEDKTSDMAKIIAAQESIDKAYEMREEPLYKILAESIVLYLSSQKQNNTEWTIKALARIKRLQKNYLPSGSGIDCGTTILIDQSKPDKIVLLCEYHHMNDVGYYVGWTSYKVIITPSLSTGFNMNITGRDRNDIKEYLYQTYEYCLNEYHRHDIVDSIAD
jgi:hypothetical protein